MPRFPNPSDPLLNPLKKARETVIKKNQIKYKNNQPDVASQLAVGQDSSSIFEGFISRMSGILTSLNEVYHNATLQTRTQSVSENIVIDRFVSVSAGLGKQTRDMKDFYSRKMNFTFNGLAGSDVQECARIVGQCRDLLTRTNDHIATLIENAQRGRATQARNSTIRFLQEIQGVMEANYSVDLDSLLKLITDGLKAYRGIPTGPTPVGAGRKRRGGVALYSKEPVLRGGQGVAGRTGLQYTTWASGLGPFPPRNTADRIDLPRRFL